MPKTLKSDLKFKVLKVRGANRYVATRYATYTPVLGDWWDRRDDGSIVRALAEVRTAWHARLCSLASVGFPRLVRGKGFSYARNCPPVGVLTDDTANRCGMAAVCPFCFGRQFVLDPFMQTELAVWGCFDGRAPQRLVGPDGRPAVALEFCVTRRLRPGGGELDEAGRLVLLEGVKFAVRKNRRREVDAVTPLGGVVLHGVRMAPDHWTLTRSGVLLCPADASAGPILSPDGPVRRETVVRAVVHPEVTRSLLARVFGRTFRYEATMLTAAAEDVAAYLTGMKGVRMLATYGVVRALEAPTYED